MNGEIVLFFINHRGHRGAEEEREALMNVLGGLNNRAGRMPTPQKIVYALRRTGILVSSEDSLIWAS